jgi:hypothetical protein
MQDTKFAKMMPGAKTFALLVLWRRRRVTDGFFLLLFFGKKHVLRKKNWSETNTFSYIS